MTDHNVGLICGRCLGVIPAMDPCIWHGGKPYHAVCLPAPVDPTVPLLTEDMVRRIVREELDRAFSRTRDDLK